MRASLVVVAAGRGTRLGAHQPKAFVELGGRTLLEHTLVRAYAAPLRVVVVVAPSDHVEAARALAARAAGGLDDAPEVRVVAGGAERTDSVAAGLSALPAPDAPSDEPEVVLVHDAARCLTPTSLFVDVIRAVAGGRPAVIPGLPVPDTIKSVDQHGRVTATPDRASLRAVQTPQGFRRDVLERAHDLVRRGRAGAMTDDAALVELLGEPVVVVDGHPAAHKVTSPADLEHVQRLL